MKLELVDRNKLSGSGEPLPVIRVLVHKYWVHLRLGRSLGVTHCDALTLLWIPWLYVLWK